MNDIRLNNNVDVKGAYSYQIIDDITGAVVVDNPEQCNLILDAYYDLHTYSPAAKYLCIGAGVVTEPSVTDIDLGNQVAAISFSTSTTAHESKDGSSATIGKSGTVNFTGLDGVEVSEIGIRDGSATGTLITRALIKDSNGNPTTILVSSGQTLRITYTLYFKLPFFIGSGMASTPHGDLYWEYRMSSDVINGAKYPHEQIGNFGTNFFFGSPDYELFCIEGKFGASINTRTPDYVNRKCTFVSNWPAESSDRTLGYPYTDGGTSYNNGKLTGQSGDYGGRYCLCIQPADPRVVIPANYDFGITYEITWGRLP